MSGTRKAKRPARAPAGQSEPGGRGVPHFPEDDRVRRLLLFLEAAVPLRVMEMSQWPPGRRVQEAAAAGDLIAHGADVLFRPDGTLPESTAARLWAPTVLTLTREQAAAGIKASGFRPAEIFNAIAKGLAIGALQPGGVTWFGQHWCTAPHGTCPGVIPAAWLPGRSPPRPRDSMTARPWADDLLLMTLTVAVPIEIDNLRGTDEETRTALGARFRWPAPGTEPGSSGGDTASGRRLAEAPDDGYALSHMDSMQYGGSGCAAAFTNTAKVLALLAYQPGGVRFGPLRWCATHMGNRWAEADGPICPACLRDETSRLTPGAGGAAPGTDADGNRPAGSAPDPRAESRRRIEADRHQGAN